MRSVLKPGAPLDSLCSLVPTAFGLVGVELGPRGVRQLRLPLADERAAWAALGNPGASQRAAPAALGDLPSRLQAYFQGEPVSFPDLVDLDSVAHFFREVYGAARAIPYGQCLTYGELAAKAGRPAAARAVGQAMSRNPACIIIPCHRVIGAGGALVGFGGGLPLKQRLLEIEAKASIRAAS